jgi:hypothetical protein
MDERALGSGRCARAKQRLDAREAAFEQRLRDLARLRRVRDRIDRVDPSAVARSPFLP